MAAVVLYIDVPSATASEVAECYYYAIVDPSSTDPFDDFFGSLTWRISTGTEYKVQEGDITVSPKII